MPAHSAGQVLNSRLIMFGYLVQLNGKMNKDFCRMEESELLKMSVISYSGSI